MILIITSVLYTSFSETAAEPKKKPKIKPSDKSLTPFQRGLKKGIEKRINQGKPHPKFNTSIIVEENGNYLNITGITTIVFEGPGQSGKEHWPDFIVESSEPHNYTEDLIALYPDIYGPNGSYTFGDEPRNYTIIEHFNITYPDEINSFSSSLSSSYTSLSSSTICSDILMGFTLAPPKIDWTIGTEITVLGFTIFKARAGFCFDFAFGLRLPVSVSMTHPDLMTVEHSYTPSTSLTPLNWDTADYANAGILADGGNEFVFRFEFFLGLEVIIAGVEILSWGIPTVDVDKSVDFETPFGVGSEFPIPSLILPSSETGLEMEKKNCSIGIGIKVDPSIGSETIRAKWSTSGDASGSGSIEYHVPGEVYPFGPPDLYADDLGPTDYAEISLHDFEYVFDIFFVTIGVRIEFGGHLAILPDLPWFDLFTFDLSEFSALLSLGVHDGTPGTVDVEVFVQNFGINLSVDPDTLNVEPGYWGNYTASLTNTGNVPDTFDTFTVEGLPPQWEYTLPEGEIPLSPGETTSFALDIKPWRHWSTSPGDYPFTLTGDSEGAKDWGLIRTDSYDATLEVLQFFEPGISIVPTASTVKPGETASYALNVTNYGNDVDSFELTLKYPDFTSYRAVPSAIPLEWTYVDNTQFGPLDPAAYEMASLSVSVPSDWAGIEDTTYEINATATSLGDTAIGPPASKSSTAGLIVEATKESMTRYIGLEIAWLTEDVAASDIEDDVKVSLLDKLECATTKNGRALSYILAGREKQADNMLKACQNVVNAFMNLVEAQMKGQPGKHIPIGLAEYWKEYALQIMADLETTIATPLLD